MYNMKTNQFLVPFESPPPPGLKHLHVKMKCTVFLLVLI